MSEMERMAVRFSEPLRDGMNAEVKGRAASLDGMNRESRLSQWVGHTKSEVLTCMQRGYEEMARINLRIAAESFLVEQEAGGTVERLVSGV